MFLDMSKHGPNFSLDKVEKYKFLKFSKPIQKIPKF